MLGAVLPTGFISILACLFWGVLLNNGYRKVKAVSIVPAVYFTVGIVLMDSRAALLSLACGVFYLLYCTTRIENRKKICVPFFFGLLLLFLFLLIKRPASAIGRLYIWRVCLDMFFERPMGFGWNGFTKNYMWYQADYLSSHPDTPFHIIADNVAFPYNELFQIAISFGIIALVVLLFVIWNVLSSPLKSKKEIIVTSLLIDYLVFSSFSYPSDSLLTGLLFPILLLLSPKRVIKHGINILCGFMLVLSLFLYYKRDTLAWKIRKDLFVYNEGEYMSLLQKEKDNLAYFPELEDMLLSRVPSRRLMLFSEYILDCATRCPNTESLCRAGDVYAHMDETALALNYYEKASRMVPSRLMPRYKAFCLLLECGNNEEAAIKGNEILSMSLKVRSSKAIQIRYEVEQLMITLNLTE